MSDRRLPRSRAFVGTVLGILITAWLVIVMFTRAWIWKMRNKRSTELNPHRTIAATWERQLNGLYDSMLGTKLEVECNILPLEPGKPVLIVLNHPPIPTYTKMLRGIFDNIIPDPASFKTGEWSVFVVMKGLTAGNPLAPALEMADVGLVVDRGDADKRKASITTVEQDIGRLANKQVVIILFADESRFTVDKRDKSRVWMQERYPDRVKDVNNVLTPRVSGLQAIRRAIPDIRVLDGTVASTRRCDTLAQVEPLIGARIMMDIRDIELPESDEEVRLVLFDRWAWKDTYIGEALADQSERYFPMPAPVLIE